MFFALTIISINVNFPYTMCLLTGHFVKLKSVIFLLCNLEAISSNFIPVKFSGHTVCHHVVICTDTSYVIVRSPSLRSDKHNPFNPHYWDTVTAIHTVDRLTKIIPNDV